MNIKTLERSYAGGVVAPELYGRIDLTKNQTGLAQALNFWTLPHGPAQNRPGFEYVLETKDSTKASRAVPFEYSTTQTYALELGAGYVRFHTSGATVLEAAQNITAITQANPGVLTYAGADPSNGDWMFLTGIGGMTQLNGRFVKVANVNAGANTFELTDFAGVNINTTAYGAYTAGGTVSRVYEVVSPYAEADLFDIHYTQSADVLTLVHPNYAPRELRRLGATNWTLTLISFAPTILPGVAPTLTNGGPGGGTATVQSYVYTAIAQDGLEESLASPVANSAAIDLTVAGNYTDVDPPVVATAVRYNIYKLKNGLYGYIGQTDGSALRDNNITADMSKTPAINDAVFAGAGDWPAAVGYFEGRRMFGGTDNKPQNLWMSRSGTESNFSYSIPTRDDDRIAFRIAARQANRIRHIVPLDALLLLTSGGEWKVQPQNSDILTPDSAWPKQGGAEGANNVTPVVTGSSVLYAQARGGRVRELKYKWESQGFVSEDISIMAPHLFDGYSITDMAYVRAPHKMLFSVRNDGLLLGLTYLPEHQVVAWHTHDTQGTFQSVASVVEGSEDALYAVVKRHVNGRDVRYFERMHSRRIPTQASAFFVDSGVTYSGAAITTLSAGLWHLEGMTVTALADGAVVPDQVVTNGTITLSDAASVINVGLKITADLKTLPLAVEAAQAAGQGLKKNVNEVWMRVNESSGIFAGPTTAKLREYAPRTSEPYGSPPALKSDEVHIVIDNKWTQSAQVCVRQTAPLPLTILSMTLGVAVGG